MRTNTLRCLRCPLCREPLAEAGQAVRCPRGHSFDLARQGYVSLLAGRVPHAGDTAEMVAARDEFAAAGHFAFISAALSEAAALSPAGAPTEADALREASAPTEAGAPSAAGGAYPGLVVDVGAGTGRHLAAVLDALPDATGLALDVSKPALRRAARAHPRADAVLCDAWGPLPLADSSVGLLLNVFAPRNGAEFHRVLRPDGTLLVVTPTTDHLAELVERLDLLRVDPDKAERLAGSLSGHFDLVASADHRRALALTRREVRSLVRSGPNAWHTDPERLAERTEQLPEPFGVTASVRVTAYRPR